MDARVVMHNGSPAISVNGEIIAPMAVTAMTRKSDYLAALGAAGIRIFYLICDTDWLRPDGYDQLMDDARTLLDAVPEALILLRIGLHPPTSWLEAHPEELITYQDGSHQPAMLYTESYTARLPGMYALTSAAWQRDAGAALLSFHRRLCASPYAEHYIGCFLAAGGTSEWYPINDIDRLEEGLVGDCSPAFRAFFTRMLREKYRTVEALREAWRYPDASFDDPPIPPAALRFLTRIDRRVMDTYEEFTPAAPNPGNGTNIGSFLDADAHQAVADFYRAWHLGTADAINHFGRLIKEADPGRLVGAFYGSLGCTNYFGGGTAAGTLSILDSGCVDFLAAPGLYDDRGPGGVIAQREMQDSFRLRGRIFVVEDDTRTHLDSDYFRDTMRTYDIPDTLGVLKRDFGRNLCEDLYGWWFDQIRGGGRYEHPDIYALFARQQEVARAAFAMDRVKDNQIAMIYDEESLHYVSQQTSFELCDLQRTSEMHRIGAPVDYYFHDDLARADMPAYRMYVFMNVFCLTGEERAAIRRKLARDGAVAVFTYAPGLIDPGAAARLHPDNVSALTGMTMRMIKETWSPRFRVAHHPATAGADPDRLYGWFDRRIDSSVWMRASHFPSYLYPVIYADDPDAAVLGRFAGNGLPALTLKEQDGWASIHCGAKVIRSDLLRGFARYAGAHVYADGDDILYANRSFVTLHASAGGMKRLSFPTRVSPYEVYERQHYGKGVLHIDFPMRLGETKTFCLRGAI